MHFDIPENINPALLGLNWLLGVWEGNGHGSWPGEGDFEYGQRIEFSSNGEPFLHYISQLWTLDDNGQPAAPLTMETGFWLPHDDATLDVLITHPEGWVEMWAGRVQGARIDLATDLVARIPSNPREVSGGQRLYGNVDGDLMWTWDRASTGVPLQPYLWARLTKVPADA
jgi:hypothetical protein